MLEKWFKPKRMPWAAFLAPALLVVLLFWLPFGFKMGGLIEEWGVLALYAQRGVIYVADAGSALEAHRLRPLTVLPHAVAYALDPTSFRYWHVLAMLALVVKTAGATYLGRWLTRSWGWGALFGLLVVVYPADTMQHSFRALHINYSVALVLLGSALLLKAGDAQSLASRAMLSLGAGVSLAVACLMYEAALLLAVLPFGWMFARDGLGETLARCRRTWLPCLVWIGAAFACAAYFIGVLQSGQTYQGSVVGSAGLGSLLGSQGPKLFTVGFVRTFIGAWVDAAGIFAYEVSNYAYPVLATMVMVAALFWLRRADDVAESDARPRSAAVIVRTLLVAAALVALGYLPYLSSNAHIHITQRTYLFAAPGAALCVFAALWQLARASRVAAMATATALLLLGFTAQMFQLDHYQRIFEQQRQVLAQIVARAGDPGARKLLVLDYSSRLNHTWMLGGGYLNQALSFIYDHPLNGTETCLMPQGEWQVRDQWGRTGSCVRSGSDWILSGAPTASAPGTEAAVAAAGMTLTPATTLAVTVDDDPSALALRRDSANLAAMAASGTRSGQRIERILMPGHWPLAWRMFRPEAARSYRWDFGRWWSMEVPPHGAGWREAEWELGPIRQRSAAWKVAPEATLVFKLRAPEGAYQLQGRITSFASDEARSQLRILVNGQPIEVTLGAQGGLYAAIPPGLLVDGRNTLAFEGPQASQFYGLGLALDWFAVEPRATP